MKINKILTISLAAGALAACNSGTSLQTQQLDATHTALSASASADSVKAYVAQLAAVKVSNGDSDTAKTQTQLVAYYSKVKVVRTVEASDYTVDCVPFDQQPALIDASASDKAQAIAMNNRHLASIKQQARRNSQIDNAFDFKIAMCPESTVAIPRVNPAHLSELWKHVAPSKLAVGNSNAKPSDTAYNLLLANANKVPTSIVGLNTSFYSWVQTPSYTITDPSVYTTFTTPDSQTASTLISDKETGHELNQLWWLTEPGSGGGCGGNLCSLETGWIVWNTVTSTQPTLSIFTFATPDYYGSDIGNQYNTNGGFIQYSGSVSLGTPITGAAQKFTLGYSVLPNNNGYALNYSNNDESETIGYYPVSHFDHGVPSFGILNSGSEIADPDDYPATMAGTINAMGSIDAQGNKHSLSVTNGVSSVGKYSYDFSTSSNGVTFSGTHGITPIPSPSPQPTPTIPVPSGAPNGWYLESASAVNWDGSNLSASYAGVTTPTLDYANVCASGVWVNNIGNVLACIGYSNPVSQVVNQENIPVSQIWQPSCSIQEVSLDTTSANCSGSTPQTADGTCVTNLHAYCLNSQHQYVATDVNPNAEGCASNKSGMTLWNIHLTSAGQLGCGSIPSPTPSVTPTPQPSASPSPHPSPSVKPTPTPTPSSPCAGVAQWLSGSTYTQGNKVQENGILYQANWWTQSEPATNNGGVNSGEPWLRVSSC